MAGLTNDEDRAPQVDEQHPSALADGTAQSPASFLRALDDAITSAGSTDARTRVEYDDDGEPLVDFLIDDVPYTMVDVELPDTFLIHGWDEKL